MVVDALSAEPDRLGEPAGGNLRIAALLHQGSCRLDYLLPNSRSVFTHFPFYDHVRYSPCSVAAPHRRDGFGSLFQSPIESHPKTLIHFATH
jgi:hypothetical protein